MIKELRYRRLGIWWMETEPPLFTQLCWDTNHIEFEQLELNIIDDGLSWNY